MTTIVYHDGILAADTRAYEGAYNAPIGRKSKIRRLEDGTLVGVSSNIVGAGEFIHAWYADGHKKLEDKDLPDNFHLLAVKPNGDAYIAANTCNLSGPLRAEYFAIGSGDRYAFGALLMGASADEAVRIAAMADPWTGGEIDVLRHFD